METTIVEDGQETVVWTPDVYTRDQEANLMYCLKELCMAHQEVWAQDDPREVDNIRNILVRMFVGDKAIFSPAGADFGVPFFDRQVEARKNPALASVKRIHQKKGKKTEDKPKIDFFAVQS